VLIGGVQYTDSNGLRVRGESHLLLIGDPGTGKSQFLRYAAELSLHSVLTAGIGTSCSALVSRCAYQFYTAGTTSAGLTVTAVKDARGVWMRPAALCWPMAERAALMRSAPSASTIR
jgi:DNA helicase MCM9